MTLWIILGLIVLLMAYVRLAPSDPARWHAPVTASDDKTFAGGAIRVIEDTDGTFERLHEIALNTPRTTVLAGSPNEGRVTYVTRTRGFGFPDYTTIERADGQIRLFARLRFGRSDLGVNAARLDAWLGQLSGGA